MTTKATILANLADLLTPDGSGNLLLNQSPAQFDNSLKLVDSAFVQRAIGSASGLVTLSAAVAMDTSYAGKDIIFYGHTAPFTQVLPAVGTYPAGTHLLFYNPSGFAVTVQTNGSDSFSANAGSVKSIVIGSGDYLEISSFGGANWEVVGGSAGLQWSSLFGATLNSSGYQKNPSGLIFQWAPINSSGTSSPNLTFLFPIAFPNACYAAYATTTGGDMVASVLSISKTSATYNVYSAPSAALTSGVGFYLLAIGS